MGQSWDLLYPLLLKLGYIDKRMGVDNVRVKKLQLLIYILYGEEKLHLSDNHLKGGGETLLYVSREATFQCSP